MARSKSAKAKASKSSRRHKSKKDKKKSKKDKKHRSKKSSRSKSKKDRKHKSSKKDSKSKSRSRSQKHSKERHEDSGPPDFGPSECANAILVLQCGDKLVTTEALRWFEKHLAVDKNVKVFVDLKGIEALTRLMTSEDLLQRSSLKVLDIVALSQTGKLQLRDLMLAKSIIDLTASTDEVVQEHATSILASLATLYTGRIQLLQNNIIEHVPQLLNSTTEEVAKNAAEILWHLLEDPLNMDFFLGSAQTRASLLNLTASKNPDVCFAAFCVLERLAKTKEGAEALVSADLLVRLRKSLKIPNTGFAKSHRVILKLLTNLVKVPSATSDLATFMSPTIGIICGTSDEDVLVSAIEFMGRLCSVSHQARIIAEQTGFTGKLVEYLACDSLNIVQAAILASAEITAADYSKTNKKLLGAIESLLDLLHLDKISVLNFDRAIATIGHLLTAGEEVHEGFLKFRGKETMLQILNNSDKYSEDSVISAMTCLQQLGLSSAAQLAVADGETVSSVLKAAGNEVNPQVLVTAGATLSAIMSDLKVQKEFWLQNGDQFLMQLFQHDELQVTASAIPLLQVLSSTFEGQMTLFNLGILQLLLTLKHKEAINLFQPVLQKILNAHLPIKFSLTNHLDWTDIISQGFYDSGRAYCSDDLILSIANLEDTETNREKNILVVDIPEFLQPLEHFLGPEDEIPGEEFPEVGLNFNTFGGLGPLLASLQKTITAERVTREEELIQVIAEAISDHCGGAFRQSWKIGVEMQELELATLQTDYKILAIPLSMVKVGALRPRALLFKAFADRLGIRSTLERGSKSKENYWNVVFLHKEGQGGSLQKVQHQRRFGSFQSADSDSDVSSRFCRSEKSSKFVVDLMYQPGRLLSLDSEEWDDYCH